MSALCLEEVAANGEEVCPDDDDDDDGPLERLSVDDDDDEDPLSTPADSNTG